MSKVFRSLTVCRAADNNRPIRVRAVTEENLTYNFEVAPELSDKRIVSLVGRLIDFECYKPRLKRMERK